VVRLASALVWLVVISVARPAVVSAGGTMGPFPAASGCIGGFSPPQEGLDPNQLAAIYGIAPLNALGFEGQGVRIALIEPGQSIDRQRLEEVTDCYGPATDPVEHVLDNQSPPPPGTEAQFDINVVSMMAPRAERIDIFESVSSAHDQYAPLVYAALQITNTGGRLVDVISISFGACEQKWERQDIDALEGALAQAAAWGVTVVVAGGDSGSTACAQHPVVAGAPGTNELAVAYPATSPHVLTVGGTQLEIDGTIEAGGTVTEQRVWHEPAKDGAGTWGGGGGTSTLFPLPSWQQALGLTSANAQKPDVAALAGSPKYPSGGIGTSGAAPFTASGIAVVLSYLRAHHVPDPGFLTPVLYRLATTSYGRVFYDVNVGDNDIVGLGCCAARQGYDRASGLGSIRFDQLAFVLEQEAGSSSTTTLSPSTRATTAVTVAPRFTG
jgi:subtilase family serine protease